MRSIPWALSIGVGHVDNRLARLAAVDYEEYAWQRFVDVFQICWNIAREYREEDI